MTETFTVKTATFEGPLDLLLALIEDKKLPINAVSLAEVAESYLNYLKEKEDIPVSSMAQFLVIASTLLLLKSFSLIPLVTPEGEEEADIKDLERRLHEYKKIKELSRTVAELFGKKRFYFTNGVSPAPTFSPEPSFSKQFFGEIMKDILTDLPADTKLPEKEILQVATLEETMEKLIARVREKLSTSFQEWSGYGKKEGREARINVIVSFLALLELVKDEIVEIRQTAAYEDIEITQKQNA